MLESLQKNIAPTKAFPLHEQYVPAVVAARGDTGGDAKADDDDDESSDITQKKPRKKPKKGKRTTPKKKSKAPTKRDPEAESVGQETTGENPL